MRVIIESFTRPDIERMKAAVSRLADPLKGAQEGASDDVTINLRCYGGCPGQRVDFRASIPSRGEAEVTHVDELRDVDERFAAAVRPEELAALARHLDVETLMGLPPNKDEGYVPDSLIGSVVITAGNARITLWFPLEDEDPPKGENATMRIERGQVPFVLRASMAPPSVRPALAQLAAVVNRLTGHRSPGAG
ncbi:hypothetical protein [Streptomyces albireticuli]|uniref:hypothetical protein n=1 Tax=Streptomyces albireticuli TaxID=1940 RepID=UPI003685A139